MKKQSRKYRITIITIFGLVVGVVVAIIAHHLSHSFVLRNAERQIQNILFVHKSIHHYIQIDNHPVYYESIKKGALSATYYAPELFSSSYMARKIHGYNNFFRQKANMPKLYYKLAAINPRNPVNLADEFEKQLIHHFNQNRSVNHFDKIIEVNNKNYLYYAIPFLETTKACLRCHGHPKNAPIQIVKRYGVKTGFNQKVGSYNAIVSIRAPLGKELTFANILFIALSFGFITIFGLIFFNRFLYVKVKTTSSELRDSEERYKAIFNSASDGFVYIDENAIIKEANPKLFELTGLRRKDLIDKSVYELIEMYLSADTANMMIEHTDAMLGGLHAQPMEFEFNSKIFEVKTSKEYMVKGYTGILRDITQFKINEQQIKHNLEEKEILLKEIHHRVKNNLQIISSLVNLQKVQSNNKLINACLTVTESRIKSMSVIHEKLYSTQNFTSIDMGDYVETIINELFNAYNIEIFRIKKVLTLGDISLPLDNAIPCGLIITEVVSNSLKYAFPEGRNGTISISMYVKKKHNFLIIADDGIGIPENIDFGFSTSSASGLGLQLVSGLINQIHGTAEIKRDKGTAFHFSFPK